MMGKVGSLFAIFLMSIMFSSVVTHNYNANAQTLPSLTDLAAVDDGPFHIGENLLLSGIDVQVNDVNNLSLDFDTIIVTSPLHGTVTVNPDTTVDYNPALNYFGTDSFTYKLCTTDNSICSANTATVSIIVDQVIVTNLPPVAVPDRYTFPAGTIQVLNVIANDTDPENDPIHLVDFVGPAHGTLILNPDQTLTYTPFDNFFDGPESFRYAITDNQIHGSPCTSLTNCPASQIGTVSLSVTPVNHPPFANSVFPTTNENTPVSFQLSATHADPSQTLTYTVLTTPSHGSLSGTAPNLTYTPNPYFVGSDTFNYKANDGIDDSNIATVYITVIHVNQPPVAVNDRYSLNENTPIVMNVLANDTDPDIPTFGDVLAVISKSNPSHGTLNINLDNTIIYTPNQYYFGTDSFTYTISDSAGLTSTATVRMTVNHVNQPPVAVSDVASTAFNTPVIINVLANDYDPDIPNPGDTIKIISTTIPSHGGTVVINGGSTITYTPATGYSGSDSFTYTISDSAGLTSTATVNVNIGIQNHPPVAPNLGFTLIPGQTNVNINILAVTHDPDPGDTVSLVSFTNPSHGTVVRELDNSLTYTPTPGYYGLDSFTYTVSDNHGATATGTISLTMVKPNSPPVAVNDAATTVLNTPVIINVLTNDHDPDVGDTISITSFTSPSNGVTVLNPDHTFTYTPNHNYSGSDSFTYTISDNHGATATATVTITILKSTPGEIEGDGSIGKKTSFDFEVESKDGVTITGDLKYKDSSKINLKSNSFTTLYVDSTQTQGGFSGVAKVNGHDGYTFQVTVTSTGSEHHQSDTFSITVLDPNGHSYYSNSGTLTDGKIDISSHVDDDDGDNNHGDNNHGDNNHGDNNHEDDSRHK